MELNQGYSSMRLPITFSSVRERISTHAPGCCLCASVAAFCLQNLKTIHRLVGRAFGLGNSRWGMAGKQRSFQGKEREGSLGKALPPPCLLKMNGIELVIGACFNIHSLLLTQAKNIFAFMSCMKL